MKIKEFCKPEDQLAVLGNHSWSVPRLFELAKDLPIMEIPIDHLCVFNKYENLSLRAMVGHMKAVWAADLSYPIILDEDGDIMDGRHRIMKAILLEKPTIKAVRFQENPSPCRVKED